MPLFYCFLFFRGTQVLFSLYIFFLYFFVFCFLFFVFCFLFFRRLYTIQYYDTIHTVFTVNFKMFTIIKLIKWTLKLSSKQFDRSLCTLIDQCATRPQTALKFGRLQGLISRTAIVFSLDHSVWWMTLFSNYFSLWNLRFNDNFKRIKKISYLTKSLGM